MGRNVTAEPLAADSWSGSAALSEPQLVALHYSDPLTPDLNQQKSCVGRHWNGIQLAVSPPWPKVLFDNKTSEVGIVRKNQESMPLREQAMEALLESTTMLEVASNLLEQGNIEESERLHKAARTKRNVSVLLMAKANALENQARDNAA